MKCLNVVAGVVGLAVMFLFFAGCAALESAREPSWELRVSAGSEETYIDEEGRVWLADQELEEDRLWGAVGGGTVDRGDIDIPGTTAPGVYRTERFGMEKYVFTLSPGTYDVILHFAETWDGIFGPGERVFNVNINERLVLEEFDPFGVSGGLDIPVVREFKGIETVDGQIVIGFEVQAQNPLINGIEIIGY